jgi:hypothetical protein
MLNAAARLYVPGIAILHTLSEKRRVSAALQNASVQHAFGNTATFWSAAVLCRFEYQKMFIAPITNYQQERVGSNSLSR